MKKIIDLSVPVHSGTQLPPSVSKEVNFDTVIKRPGYWQCTWCEMSAHTATHVDSPLHVLEGQPTIAEVPLDKVIGEAVVLDLRSKCEEEAIIGPEDLEKFADDIKEGDIIILRTDWAAKRWDASDFSYWQKSPTLSVEGAKWLVSKKPKAIAFDCFEELNARKDGFVPDDFEMHQAILGNDVIIIEGLVNLDQLTKKRVQFFAPPIKLRDAEAAPARVFVIED